MSQYEVTSNPNFYILRKFQQLSKVGFTNKLGAIEAMMKVPTSTSIRTVDNMLKALKRFKAESSYFCVFITLKNYIQVVRLVQIY